MDIQDVRRLILRSVIKSEGAESDADFCRNHGLNPSYLSQVMTGSRSFGEKSARKFEKQIGLPFEFLDDRSRISPSESVDANVSPTRSPPVERPIISRTRAGQWEDVADPYELNDAEGWEAAPSDTGPRSFFLWVDGNSMEPEYPDGGLILVDPDIQPVHGDDVVVKTPDQQATFKRLQMTGDGVFLLALNPDFPDRIMKVPEDSTIIGVVTDYVRKSGRFRRRR